MTIRTFSVITPCFQAERLIRPTLESVLSQTAIRSGRVRLQYLICDGASRDRTVEIARDVCGDRAEVFSEPDGGMYEALARGLSRCTGEVVSYLNAGDVYAPTALDVVADVLEAFPRVRWLTGMRVACNEKLQVIEAVVPYRYRRALVAQGAYGRVLPFIQQESTFWGRELLATVDLPALARLRYAGDFFLWRTFARAADLVVVQAYLGGFTYHPGQRSEDVAAYRAELDALAEPLTIRGRLRAELDRRLWSLPPRLKKRLCGPALLQYDLATRRWR